MATRPEQVFDRFLQGDINGIDEIYKAYENRIYLRVYGIVNNEITAEKITAYCFRQVKKKAGELKTARHIVNYLYKVAYDKAVKAAKPLWGRSKTRNPVEYPEYGPDEIPDEEKFLRLELDSHHAYWAAEVKRRVEKLPRQQGDVYRLVELEGLTAEEVAELKGIDRNTVYQHLRHAKANLREYLLQRGYVPEFILFILFRMFY